MRALLPALFLAGTFGGGPHDGGCSHTGSAAHGGDVSHPSLSSAHLPIASSISHASSGNASTHAPTDPHLHFGSALARGIHQALAASAQAIEGVLGLTPESDDEPTGRACQSVEDCAEGELGHGAVCDHWSEEPRAAGICREACRTDDDCPPPMECHWGLDPAGPSRGGCVE